MFTKARIMIILSIAMLQSSDMLFARKSRGSSSSRSSSSRSSNGNIEEVTGDDQIKRHIKGSQAVFIKFWRENCPYCDMVEKPLHKLAPEYPEVTFISVNTTLEENAESSNRYASQGVPTFVFKAAGEDEPVQTRIGGLDESELRRILDSITGKQTESEEKTADIPLAEGEFIVHDMSAQEAEAKFEREGRIQSMESIPTPTPAPSMEAPSYEGEEKVMYTAKSRRGRGYRKSRRHCPTC